jgi:hypothetical protein
MAAHLGHHHREASRVPRHLTLVERSPEPERWQTNATGPCLTIEGADVAVYVLGQQRYRIVAPDAERVVEGFGQARMLAHRLAFGLDRPN